MQYRVNENGIGCGLCQRLCPEVFAVGPDGVSHAISGAVPEHAEEAAKEAMIACLANAIEE
ncbi:Ferredoxin [Aedoeadaptatus ivorii]|uniref:Ferredoxin n=1 Tax=Aedoeadaptatus ivorii TaxID=54006 RepID=A0A3S5AI95_9FIRM|nr:ferredoxin [Peptoniphilus ivorii]VEJ34517.1 Ferredoxin [Peptoniphilus ivorii]